MALPKNFKYTIYIKQKALLEISPTINLREAAVLDYIATFCTYNNLKIEAQRTEDGYTWIDYSKLIRDMPILHIKKKAPITKIVNSLENNHGLIETKKECQHGKPRKFFKLTTITENLILKNGDSEIYKLLLNINMNEKQAEQIASDLEFLKHYKKQIMTALRKAERNNPAYIYNIYDNYSKGYI